MWSSVYRNLTTNLTTIKHLSTRRIGLLITYIGVAALWTHRDAGASSQKPDHAGKSRGPLYG